MTQPRRHPQPNCRDDEDHLHRIGSDGPAGEEDERSQNQILELTKLVFGLSKDIATVAGQMQSIEKRLEDREKMMEAIIALRVKEEVEKAMKSWKPPEA